MTAKPSRASLLSLALSAGCFALTLGAASIANAQSGSNGCPDPLARTADGDQSADAAKARPTQGLPPGQYEQSRPRPRFSGSDQVAGNTDQGANYKARPTQGLPPGQYEQSRPRPGFPQNARTASNSPC